MKKQDNSIKKCQLSFKDRVKIIFNNSITGMPVIESLKNARFDTIDEFVTRVVYFHEHKKYGEQDKDFVFTLDITPVLENYLTEYLTKNKKFVFDYTTSKKQIPSSHVYQLYLQYVPYNLTEVEKKTFLDAYINMTTNLRASYVSREKRIRLEKRLNINQDKKEN